MRHQDQLPGVSSMLGKEEYYMLLEQVSEEEEKYGKVNISALSRSTGDDRKTIRKYLQPDVTVPEPHIGTNQVNWIHSRIIC